MERSSRFISLSGLSGVSAGVCALVGAAVAQWRIGQAARANEYGFGFEYLGARAINWDLVNFLLIDAALVLVVSLAAGVFFTTRNAKHQGVKTWDATSRRLLLNLGVPLVIGGVACLALLYHGLIGLLAPATLVFYGLALINGSKYTLDDIRNLGIIEAGLGAIAMFVPGYGLWFWGLGFGVLHIVYGVVMYFKYERNP